MANPQPILLGGFPGLHQVARRLRTSIRLAYSGQIARAMATHQLQRVQPIRLHLVVGLDRHPRRRYYRASHAQLRLLPIQHVTDWAGFFTDRSCSAGLSYPINLRTNLERLAIRPRRVLLHPARRRHRNRFGMDIQSPKSSLLRQCRFVSSCGSGLCCSFGHSLTDDLQTGAGYSIMTP